MGMLMDWKGTPPWQFLVMVVGLSWLLPAFEAIDGGIASPGLDILSDGMIYTIPGTS